MKIILSRKGFDSSYGEQANPILPDGTLLSLPIPDPYGNNTFSDLHLDGISYYDIIRSLKPRTEIKADDMCHLDPDLRKDVKDRLPGWKPAFGQSKAALSHLRNMGVVKGDLFLFFGWFRETEMNQGKLIYKRKSKNLHVIYAYMQIGEIIDDPKSDVPDWLKEHPHVSDKKDRNDKNNAIYLPTDKLSIIPDFNGCGLLNYRKDRVLTKDGMSKGKWDLPEFFKDVAISYHPHPWKDGYFQSADKGQEFVLDATPKIIDWAKHIIE